MDGRLAFAAAGRLLGLGPAAGLSYPQLLREDGLSLREERADFAHLAFRLGEDEAGGDESGGADGDGGTLLSFPGGRSPT